MKNVSLPLPRASSVIIPRTKLVYSLEQDLNKKRLWGSILGFSLDDIDIVEQQIRVGVKKYGSTLHHTDQYGNHYFVVILMISHMDSDHRVLTSWIDDAETNETRLTTVYPLADKDNREAIRL